MSKTKNNSGIFGKILVVLLIVGLAVGLSAGLGKLTDGYTKEMSTILNNKDNLIHTLEEYESKEGNDGSGLTWEVTSRGAVKVKGKLDEDASASEFVLGTVTIPKDGKYTLSGLTGATYTTAYIKATYVDGTGATQTFYGDMTGVSTVELTQGTQVVIKIVVEPNTEIDTTVYPTLVVGSEAGKF